MNGPDDFLTVDEIPKTLKINDKLLDLAHPVVMGILNVTPDSFSDGGKYVSEQQIIDRAGEMIKEGASIIDIGGQSTRPGARRISSAEESDRVIPAIKSVLNVFPEIPVSVDTFYGDTAYEAIREGAGMVNDISAGSIDETILDAVADSGVVYVLMHMKGTPEDMQKDPKYDDITGSLMTFFSEQLKKLSEREINEVVIDPGFGFGKRITDNFRILQQLGHFKNLGKPVLAGLSRKSMIFKPLNTKPDQAVNGTTALNMIALMQGANILRVHDVKQATETVALFREFTESGSSNF